MVPKNIMRLTDEKLLSKIADGNSSYYELLFEKYKSKIYNFAYNIVKNKEDAKDAVQDAFIKVYEALPKLSGNINFSAYLYKTTRNVSIDLLRQKKRFTSAEPLNYKEDLDLNVSPQKSSLLQEQQEQVRAAATDLPEDYRTVLGLREVDEHNYEQISAIMQIPQNSVGVLLLRARLKFKEVFRMKQVDVEKLSKQCKDMMPLLSGYVDNELTDTQREKVEGHLKDCPLCRLALEEMTEASKSYRAIIPLIVPVAIKAGVFDKIGILAKAPNLKDLGSQNYEQELSESPTKVHSLKSSKGSANKATQKSNLSEQQTRKIDAKSSGKALSTKSGTKESDAITDSLKIKKSMFKRIRALSAPKKLLLVGALLLLLIGGTLIGVYGSKEINKEGAPEEAKIEKPKSSSEEPNKATPKESTTPKNQNNKKSEPAQEENSEEQAPAEEEEQNEDEQTNKPNEQPPPEEQNPDDNQTKDPNEQPNDNEDQGQKPEQLPDENQ